MSEDEYQNFIKTRTEKRLEKATKFNKRGFSGDEVTKLIDEKNDRAENSKFTGNLEGLDLNFLKKIATSDIFTNFDTLRNDVLKLKVDMTNVKSNVHSLNEQSKNLTNEIRLLKQNTNVEAGTSRNAISQLRDKVDKGQMNSTNQHQTVCNEIMDLKNEINSMKQNDDFSGIDENDCKKLEDDILKKVRIELEENNISNLKKFADEIEVMKANMNILEKNQNISSNLSSKKKPPKSQVNTVELITPTRKSKRKKYSSEQ